MHSQTFEELVSRTCMSRHGAIGTPGGDRPGDDASSSLSRCGRSVAPRCVARWFNEIIPRRASNTPFDPRRVLYPLFSRPFALLFASSFFPLFPSPFFFSVSLSLTEHRSLLASHHRACSTNRRAFLAILLELINEYRCHGLFIERVSCVTSVARRLADAMRLRTYWPDAGTT